MLYFGPWDDPEAALVKYRQYVVDEANKPVPRSQQKKPKPPTKDFPLYAHRNGQWAKTVKNKDYYFGPWDDPTAALNRWLDQKDHLLAGKPRVLPATAHTLGEICRRFLNSKRSKMATGELTNGTVDGYQRECDRLVAHFGEDKIGDELTPFDFEGYRQSLCRSRVQEGRKGRASVGKPLGPHAMTNAIMAIRTLLKYAYKQDMLSRPAKFGDGFDKPSSRMMREARNNRPRKLFTPSDIKEMLREAKQPLKSMILLGINCGFGNTDCAKMEFRHLDLLKQWVDYPRPKTGVIRWSPLWPETCAALHEWIKMRPEPRYADSENRVFLTLKKHTPWDNGKGYDPVGNAMAKVIRTIGIDQYGLGFYALRHTFFTIGEACRDQKAIEFIMGHAPDSRDMSPHYREEFTRERLMAVTQYVHDWLYARPASQSAFVAAPRMVSELQPDSTAFA
jgi:integrase